MFFVVVVVVVVVSVGARLLVGYTCFKVFDRACYCLVCFRNDPLC